MKCFLQVDALGQAVGGDEHVRAVALGEFGDPAFTFGRWQLAGDGDDVHAVLRGAERGGEVLGDVVGGVDEAAEHDRAVAVVEQRLDLLGDRGQLAVLLRAGQLLGAFGESEQPATFRA